MTEPKKSKKINKKKDLIRKSIELKGESKYTSDMILDKDNNKES